MKNFSPKSMRLRFLKTSSLAFLFVLSTLQSFAEVKIESSATGLPVSEETIKSGEALFKAKCSACHALDRAMTGPALGDVTTRREMDWLLKWIKNNIELQKSGDADAIALYNEWAPAQMQVFTDLSDDQIKSILMYTENGPLAAPVVDSGAAAPAEVDPSVFNKTNTILFLLALLVFIVAVLITKTLDYVGKLTGREVIPWNNLNAVLMLVFLIVGLIAGLYELSIHGKYALLWNASSAHGGEIDRMMKATFIITGFVFFVTQILLFTFAFKYRKKEGVKAYYYPENDRLEILWTAVPAIVLTILVLGGLKAWRHINYPEPGSAEVEVFAQQFAWKVRYPGADGKLGEADYKLISETSNPLGVAIPSKAEELLKELEADVEFYKESIKNLPEELGNLKSTLGGRVGQDLKKHQAQIDEIESGDKEDFYNLQIRRRTTQIERIKLMLSQGNKFIDAANDDIIGDEIHLVVNKPVTFKFRSRDVIHSALMKEFRAQMNVVPGIPTQFTFTPVLTTEEKRTELNNPEFDYHIICNKICGNSHYNMKIKIVVEDQKSYDKWMSEQKATFAQDEPAAPAVEETPAEEPADEASEENAAEEVAMN